MIAIKNWEKPYSSDTLPQDQPALVVPTRNFFAPLRALNMETASKSNPYKLATPQGSDSLVDLQGGDRKHSQCRPLELGFVLLPTAWLTTRLFCPTSLNTTSTTALSTINLIRLSKQ
jgi:hypothetical protein